jgi:histidine triad (HIT) family protein
MSTIFSRILQGEIPAYKVAENENFLAFLDVNPLCAGHTLVIPKRETDYIFDIEDSELAALHLFAKKVAIAIKQIVPCKKIGVAVVGLEVPHAHIHLVPMNRIGDLNFAGPRVSLSREEFTDLAARISAAMASV